MTLHTGGWPDNYELTGDPHSVATAAHITQQALDEKNINLDDVPADVLWSSLGRLVLGPYAAWSLGNAATSRFRVRHTSRDTSSMEEVWFLYE